MLHRGQIAAVSIVPVVPQVGSFSTSCTAGAWRRAPSLTRAPMLTFSAVTVAAALASILGHSWPDSWP